MPEWAATEFAAAYGDQLGIWTGRILSVGSLDELFARSGRIVSAETLSAAHGRILAGEIGLGWDGWAFSRLQATPLNVWRSMHTGGATLNAFVLKVRWYLAGVLIALLGVANSMAVEEAEYAVVLKQESFELRRYAPHIVAETVVDGGFEEAGSKAFGRLFKYISGNNRSSRKVAMTSPVGQQPQSERIEMTSPVGQQQVNDQWVVSFMMPASFTLATLPQPADPAVTLREVPARYIAAVQYSGFWSEKNYALSKEKLEAWIASQSLTVAGEPAWARYDPPFKPWFLRRNEILVPVADPSR